MYVSLLSCIVLILRLLPPVVSISSPGALTREVGQDVVFMFNASNTIQAFNWGIRDGNTDNLKEGLINYDTQDGMKLDDKINSSSYAGRVSFVGDLSKNHAWFKIINLNINDTNQYMAKIFTQGSSGYTNLPVRLTVVMPPPISSPVSLTREAGEDVVFMVNGTAMSEATWGVRDGNTNDLNPRLYRVFNPGGAFPDTQINSTNYARRVSFVGDLTKGQAWFKITNLNINDTNQYLAKIILLGESSYRSSATSLTVHPITTRPPQTATTESTSAASTFALPTTSQTPQLSNQSISIKVVSDVRGDLSDPNSAAFGNFSQNFISEVYSVYRTAKNFEKAKVTSLRENSIPVTFIVYFKSTTKPDEICAPLREAVSDNRLGSLNIIPGSLGCSKEPSQGFPKNQSSPACQCTSIIAACVTVIILLILAVMILIIYIWRLRSSNTRKGAGNSRSIQEKDLETYENVHPMENTSEARITRTERTPKNEKELYETINERGNKVTTTASAKPVRGDSPSTQHEAHSLPQHYQELQRKTPNAIPLYEPLDQRDGNNGKRTQGPNTYEQLQKNASEEEYQSLSSRYKGTESKV